MNESKTLKWVFIIAGGIGILLISFTLIYDMLIPDICYYHTHEMNSFIALFYSASPATNGHPEPNIVNFILSIILGGIIGNKIYKLMIKNRDKSNL